MVAVIVAPTLVILIVQVTTFPLTLHTIATVNEVSYILINIGIVYSYNKFIAE